MKSPSFGQSLRGLRLGFRWLVATETYVRVSVLDDHRFIVESLDDVGKIHRDRVVEWWADGWAVGEAIAKALKDKPAGLYVFNDAGEVME